MKLAIVTSSFPLKEHDPAAAAGVFVRDFGLALARLGHEIHVLTQDKGEGCEFAPPGVRVHCFPWPGRDKPLSRLRMTNPLDAAAALRFLGNGGAALRQLHDDVGLDHVIAMWAVPGGLFARTLRRRSGVPYSVWCLGSDIWTYGKLPLLRNQVADVMRRAEFVFADGIALARDAEALAGRSVDFLPSSRSLEPALHADPASRDTPAPRFLFVGRYAEVKGVDVLLRAFARFSERSGAGSLQMLGGGPWDALVRDLVRELGLEDRVAVGGYADLETVVSHARSSDAFVIPSRMESIPLVLSDAVRLGKPVIVTDVGDMGALLRETPGGLVVPPDDVESLARAMGAFAESPAGTFEAGVSSLAARFDLANAASRYVAAIGKAAHG